MWGCRVCGDMHAVCGDMHAVCGAVQCVGICMQCVTVWSCTVCGATQCGAVQCVELRNVELYSVWSCTVCGATQCGETVWKCLMSCTLLHTNHACMGMRHVYRVPNWTSGFAKYGLLFVHVTRTK